MLIEAPFQLPPGWLRAFGYLDDRRLVSLYWEPCGDEACFCDGRISACGVADNWMYLNFVRRPEVRAWLTASGIHLGNSDEDARDWLVVDAVTGRVFAAPATEARRIVVGQSITGTEE